MWKKHCHSKLSRGKMSHIAIKRHSGTRAWQAGVRRRSGLSSLRRWDRGQGASCFLTIACPLGFYPWCHPVGFWLLPCPLMAYYPNFWRPGMSLTFFQSPAPDGVTLVIYLILLSIIFLVCKMGILILLILFWFLELSLLLHTEIRHPLNSICSFSGP
jgi:hypothetical protein